MASNSTYDIDNWIKNSHKMEFSWCVDYTELRHTGVLLKFNTMPVMTFDFGANTSGQTAGARKWGYLQAFWKGFLDYFNPSGNRLKKMVASHPLNGEINISLFNSDEQEIKGGLVEFPLTDEEEKVKVCSTVDTIKKIEMGEYTLMGNNCRNYVITIALFLRDFPEFSGENWSRFENDMAILLSEDHQKFDEAIITARSILANRVKASLPVKTKKDQQSADT